MTPKKLWIWNLVLMFLPLVITLMILPHLPNQIPAHYGFDGQVDRWGSKYEDADCSLSLPSSPVGSYCWWRSLLVRRRMEGKTTDGLPSWAVL